MGLHISPSEEPFNFLRANFVHPAPTCPPPRSSTGRIPKQLGQLCNLTALYLHGNKLTGEKIDAGAVATLRPALSPSSGFVVTSPVFTALRCCGCCCSCACSNGYGDRVV